MKQSSIITILVIFCLTTLIGSFMAGVFYSINTHKQEFGNDKTVNKNHVNGSTVKDPSN